MGKIWKFWSLVEEESTRWHAAAAHLFWGSCSAAAVCAPLVAAKDALLKCLASFFVVVLPASCSSYSIFSLLIKKQKPSLDDLNGAASAEIQYVLYFWAPPSYRIWSVCLGRVDQLRTDTRALCAVLYIRIIRENRGATDTYILVITRTRKLNACSACQLSGN